MINFSMKAVGLTRTDRLRFLWAYDPGVARDRGFMRAVEEKTDRIAHRDPRRVRRVK